MKKVGCREFKNRQGHYLKRVRRGETLVLTDRGKPIAHVIPAQEWDSLSLEEKLKELERQGHLRLSRGEGFSPFDPIPAKGKPASQIILEDREGR